VDASELQRWRAGTKAAVHIQRRDRFRNVITAKTGNPRMTGELRCHPRHPAHKLHGQQPCTHQAAKSSSTFLLGE
jgi:hypothetical protein